MSKGFDMAGPIEHIRQTLVDRIRQIIDDHRADGRATDAGLSCSCGAKGLTDQPLHVAEQIVDGLGLKPHSIDEAKKQIRYATASLDWELTKLEGAEC
jgi:hypothetical protein